MNYMAILELKSKFKEFNGCAQLQDGKDNEKNN